MGRLHMKIGITDLPAFGQGNRGSAAEIQDSAVVDRTEELFHFRQQSVGCRRAGSWRTAQRCQKKIPSGAKTKSTIFPAIIRTGAHHRNQLPPASGKTESHHLDTCALKRIAVFIEYVPRNCAKRRQAEIDVAHLLSGSQRERCSGPVWSVRPIGLGRKSGMLYPETVRPSFESSGEPAIAICVRHCGGILAGDFHVLDVCVSHRGARDFVCYNAFHQGCGACRTLRKTREAREDDGEAEENSKTGKHGRNLGGL